ncbi:MAG: NAD-dependent protein deacylase [Pirellulales bacterium]|nr:NAD-dependent protein deacylase [Pirellulales bacterium]
MTLSPVDQETIDQIVERLSPESRVLFITGAGMSADSGLPTYRGIGGLYNREHTDEGIPIEEALSGDMLLRRPELCWKYLAQIGRAAMGSTFNRGHQVLAEMEEHFAHACVLTQNIDGYHRAAGSRNVIDIHGDMHSLCCMACSFEESVDQIDEAGIPPRCPECGSIVRPRVVLFGEMLPADKVSQLVEELEGGFDVVFSIGTTNVFPYIAQPVLLAVELGWTAVEINPDRSKVSHLVDFRLPARAAVALDAIWDQYRGSGQ